MRQNTKAKIHVYVTDVPREVLTTLREFADEHGVATNMASLIRWGATQWARSLKDEKEAEPIANKTD